MTEERRRVTKVEVTLADETRRLVTADVLAAVFKAPSLAHAHDLLVRALTPAFVDAADEVTRAELGREQAAQAYVRLYRVSLPLREALAEFDEEMHRTSVLMLHEGV